MWLIDKGGVGYRWFICWIIDGNVAAPWLFSPSLLLYVVPSFSYHLLDVCDESAVRTSDLDISHIYYSNGRSRIVMFVLCVCTNHL